MKKIFLLLLLVFLPVSFVFAQVGDTYKSEYSNFIKDNPTSTLTYPEYFSISNYKNMDYSSYNTYLRIGEIYGKHTPARVKLMVSGLRKLKSVQGKSYRGTSFEDYPDLFTSYTKIGDIVSDPGFFSTSVSRKVAESFLTDNGEEFLMLMVIEGQNGKDLSGIGGVGIDKAEREILYPAGTKFKIIKTNKIRVTYPDYDLDNTEVTEVILKEVLAD